MSNSTETSRLLFCENIFKILTFNYIMKVIIWRHYEQNTLFDII